MRAGTTASRRAVKAVASFWVVAAIFGAVVSFPLGGQQDTLTFATTYWVSPRGSDSAAGNADHPWRTVQHAVEAAAPSTIVQLQPGTYAPFTVDRPDLTIVGRDPRRTVIAWRPGASDVVLIDAPRTILSNLDISGCRPRDLSRGYENSGSSSVSITPMGSGSRIAGVRIVGQPSLNKYGLDFGCYGVSMRGAHDVTVRDSDISRSGYGVFVLRGGEGVQVLENKIHDNASMIRNTPSANDDFGAIGIGFAETSGLPGPVASGNSLWANSAQSHDYGTDGGAFEIFSASHVTMIDNVMENNEDVLETGGESCRDNDFSHNVARGRTPGSHLRRAVGLLLRCAANMTVFGNQLSNFDWWVFDLSGDAQAMHGLRIVNNQVIQGLDLTYQIGTGLDRASLTLVPNSYSYVQYFARDVYGRFLGTVSSLLQAVRNS